MADLIVKKAEHTQAEIALLSVDSPGVVTFTDLDTLGLTSVTFETGVSVGGGGGGEPAQPPPGEYYALCDARFHSADEGGLSNGVWVGASHDEARDAFNDADAHEDGNARVMCRVGGVLLGPLNRP